MEAQGSGGQRRRPAAVKTPVIYAGLQRGEGLMPDFYLVNEPSGTTVEFDPVRHVIVGSAQAAVPLPRELVRHRQGGAS